MKAVVINDLSGVGRCSLTVALPILSAMGIQCCPVPTAILSNQTEYPSYYLTDYTPHMENYLSKWNELGFTFDAIATGFLSSTEQIKIVTDYIKANSFETILVDPVMGDHGMIYDSYTDEMCKNMKELAKLATVLTPNLTEACILTGIKYDPENFDQKIYKKIAKALCDLGPSTIIITGIEMNDWILNYIYKNDGSVKTVRVKRITPSRPGTGDVFASVLLGSLLNQETVEAGTKKAADFIKLCLKDTAKLNIPINEGVCFEQYLRWLI